MTARRFTLAAFAFALSARPFGQPSAGPALERLQVPREQLLDRSLVSGPLEILRRVFTESALASRERLSKQTSGHGIKDHS